MRYVDQVLQLHLIERPAVGDRQSNELIGNLG